MELAVQNLMSQFKSKVKGKVEESKDQRWAYVGQGAIE